MVSKIASAGAVEVEGALHELCETARDRQAEAGAALLAGGGPIDLVKRQEDLVELIRGHADAAARFGTRALRLAEEHDLGPFYTGYAHEALARLSPENERVFTPIIATLRSQVENA